MQNEPNSVQISRWANGPGRHLLRSHVRRSTREHAGLGQSRVALNTGDAEVHQLNAAARAQHDVACFDVAMNDSPRVRDLQGIQHPEHDPPGILRLQRSFFRKPQRQRRALAVFHRDIVIARDLSDLVDVRNRWSLEARGGSRFPAESLKELRTISRPEGVGHDQHLDGHPAIQIGVSRQVDDAGRPSSQFFLDDVLAERLGHDRFLLGSGDVSTTFAGERRNSSLSGHRNATHCAPTLSLRR